MILVNFLAMIIGILIFYSLTTSLLNKLFNAQHLKNKNEYMQMIQVINQDVKPLDLATATTHYNLYEIEEKYPLDTKLALHKFMYFCTEIGVSNLYIAEENNKVLLHVALNYDIENAILELQPLDN